METLISKKTGLHQHGILPGEDRVVTALYFKLSGAHTKKK